MLTVFLPCRAGSERIPNKNTKSFAGIEGGLLKIKLNQLIDTKLVDLVIVSSNDDKVEEIVNEFKTNGKVRYDHRPDSLALSSTSTDELMSYVPSIIDCGDVLWTHVTSPFIDANEYERIIQIYKGVVERGYDSLMTVKKVQSFMWDDKGPINYKRTDEKWPRTQTLNPIYEVNSGAFICSANVYQSFFDRVGEKVFLCEQDSICSLDIDWPDDFHMAERMWSALRSNVNC